MGHGGAGQGRARRMRRLWARKQGLKRLPDSGGHPRDKLSSGSLGEPKEG